jgi:hypothetical protein
MAMGWKGKITGLIESVDRHERKMSVSLTICSVNVSVAANLFHK